MGIKNMAAKAAKGTHRATMDYMVGRTMRKIAEEQQSRQEPVSHEDEVLSALSDGFDPDDLQGLRDALHEQGIDTSNSRLVPLEMSDLVRRILYDSGTPDPELILREMGWSTPSAEVVEMHAKASEKRVDRVAGLSSLVHVLAQAALLPSSETDDWDEEEFSNEYEFAAHATMAIISQLVDIGLLDVGMPLESLGVVERRGGDSDE